MHNRLFRCQLPLMMACGLLPIPVLLYCFWGSGSLMPWLAVPAAYLALACACMLLPGRRRLLYAISGMAVLFAGGFWALGNETLVLRMAVALLYTLLLLITLPMAGWERGREPPMAIPAACICAHLLAQLFLFFKPPANAAVSALLIVSFILFLLLFMLSLNRQSLASAMPDSHTVPLSIRRRSRLLTWLMLGFVLLISLIPAFAKMLRQAFEWIRQAVVLIAKWLMSLFASREASGTGGMGAQELLGGLEGEETSLLAQILEKIAMALAAAVIVLAMLWAIRFVYRKLKKLAAYLYGRLRQYASSVSEDYVDELEDTRLQGEERFGSARRILFRRHIRRSLKDLSPREQIRARYGMLRGRHPEWNASQTARETLEESSARLYEKARYSRHEITRQESDAFAARQKH